MNSYRLKKERERLLVSALSVIGSISVVVLLSWVLNLFRFEDFSDYSGPVKITFGSEISEVESEVITPEVVKEEPVDVEPIEEVVPEIEETPIPEPPQPKEVTEPTPEPTVEEVKEVVPEVVKPDKPPEPVIKEGRESGNSHETSFETSSTDIGRSAYFPIADYMPLPKTITMDIYAFITADLVNSREENILKFEKFYMKNGDIFTLIDSVKYENRPDLWYILEGAGYDRDNAEYKQEGLETVIIIFEIEKTKSGSNNIKSAEIEKSSGSEIIDEAVLYGFKQSTYSNATESVVKGRFKYSFR